MAWFSTRFSDLQGVHTIPETGSRYVRDPTILMFTVKCSILHSHIILLHICITGHISGLLIGDRGYTCLRHLMTPYPEPHPDPETRFNVALSKTRARIEMSFGILKSRFSCLRGLRCAPNRACDITVACVVLNNIAIIRKERAPSMEPPPPDIVDPITTDHEDGRMVSPFVTEQFFS